jgi:hypothetical protein
MQLHQPIVAIYPLKGINKSSYTLTKTEKHTVRAEVMDFHLFQPDREWVNSTTRE